MTSIGQVAELQLPLVLLSGTVKNKKIDFKKERDLCRLWNIVKSPT